MTGFKKNPDILYVQQNEEVALFNSKTGGYFGLDQVGTFIWNKLDTLNNKQDIVNAIRQEYEIGEEECSRDFDEFIDELIGKELVFKVE